MMFGDGIDWNNEARRMSVQAPPGTQPGEMAQMIRETLGRLALPDTSWGSGLRIVDCGCNIGTFCPQFLHAGFEYVGVDQSAEALRIASQRWSGTFARAFLWDDWPAHLGPFDVAICNAVLQHNLHAEKERILPRIAQAVNVDGLFAMQESTVLQETRTQLRQDQWVSLVERHGFKLLKAYHPNELGIEDGYVFRRV